MNWIQPTFSQPSIPPKKKQRIDRPHTQPSLTAQAKNGNFKTSLLHRSSWLDKYYPKSKTDLIIHKKKIEEVESWVSGMDDSKFLLLTGPPGVGKMTTLKVVCKHLQVQVSEWITPPTQVFDPDNFTLPYTNQQRMFEEFLIRASRYSSVLSTCFKRIVVVKDIPNVFVKDPLTFHEFLKRLNDLDNMSVVFILTENSLIFDLFPESVKSYLKIKTINFNPITKKSVSNVLSEIVRKERLSNSLDSDVVAEISETCDGDLRNAIMSLSFISTKGVLQTNEKKTRSKVKSAKDHNDGSLKKILVDPTVDLFHGLGRVLYAKRGPDHKLCHNPNNIVDSVTTNTNTFINMLQENYLTVFSDINSASRASDYLSIADFILRDTCDSLVSRDIALSIAVRGLMYTNQNPIKKFRQFGKSKNSKCSDLCKSYKDCIKANFHSTEPANILLDSVTYLNKMSKCLESDTQKSVMRELSCFYLMEKNS